MEKGETRENLGFGYIMDRFVLCCDFLLAHTWGKICQNETTKRNVNNQSQGENLEEIAVF